MDASARPTTRLGTRGAVASLLMTLGCFASAGQRPQEPPAASPPPPETQPAAESQPAVETQPAVPITLSLENLQMQIKQAQEAAELPEETRNRLANLYTQAIQQLQIAEQWAATTAEFEAERAGAPEKLKTIQAELATTPPDPVADVPPESARADLEQRLQQVQTDLDAEKKSQADWERERARRTTRRKEIPEALAEAKARLQTLSDSSSGAEAEPLAMVRTAQQTLLLARKLAVEREIEAYNAELASYDARRELLQARLDRAARRVGHLEKLAAAWQSIVQERARIESERMLREAREQLKRAHPAIRPFAEEREQLALRARELQAAIREATDRLSQTKTLLTQLNQDYLRITERVSAAGLTNAIGQLLRRHRGDLPNPRPIERSLRQRRDRIAAVDLARLELSERRKELLDVAEQVTRVLDALAPGVSAEERENVRQAAEETFISLLSDLSVLEKDHETHSSELQKLIATERELLQTVKRFERYIDEKILWIRSGAMPSAADIDRTRQATAWLLDGAGWTGIAASAWNTTRANPFPAASSLVLIGLLWLATPRLLRTIRDAEEVLSRPIRDNMSVTLRVFAATALLALRWPALIWYAAWLIESSFSTTDFAKAVGSGLRSVALIVLTLHAVRQILRPGGLGERHFRWNAAALRGVNRHLAWLTIVLVPSFFVFTTLDLHAAESARESLGRLAFAVAFFAIAIFVQRVLRPSGLLMSHATPRRSDGWEYRARHVWYVLALTIPAALALAAIAGYYYTAHYLSSRFLLTVWLLLGILLARALAERWLLLQVRHRAIAAARQRAALRQQQKDSAAPAPAEAEAPVIQEEKLDVASINRQSMQLLRTVLLVVSLAGVWVIWAQALPALGILREVTLWHVTEHASHTVPTADGGSVVSEYTREVPVSLADLGLALIIAIITIAAVKNVPGLLEISLLQRLPMDAGGRYAVTTVTRYVITVVGVVFAFGQIGVGWSKVQWMVAAMTVGLGFGLQEIFANLVSGLLLLFERPIRIGDTVTVGDISGTVSRIRTRATTIMGWDRKELIIPNKEFITGKVINWTLSDATLRLVVPVGIAYGSNVQLARDLLLQIGRDHPLTLEDPAPHVFFKGFGASSLDFELRVFIGALEHFLATYNEIHYAIDEAFRKAGIEIAFPQRDIHIRSIQGVLPIADGRAATPDAVQPPRC